MQLTMMHIAQEIGGHDAVSRDEVKGNCSQVGHSLAATRRRTGGAVVAPGCAHENSFLSEGKREPCADLQECGS